MKKRIIALFMVLCMIPFVPYSASAEDESGNLALGKSYTISGNGVGFEVYTADLTDGKASDDMETLFNDDWFSFYYNMNNWGNPDTHNTENGRGIVTVDLGSVQSVGRVKIHLGNNAGAAVYEPQYACLWVSNDGVDFERVDYFSLNSIISGYGIAAYWTEVSFVPITARYVRIELKASTYHTFINEIEVYADGKPAPKGMNIALGADYAISGNGIGFDTYTADLTDGKASNDTETLFNDNWFSFYYNLNVANPDTFNTENGYGIVTVDLGAKSQINSMRLHLGNNWSAAVYEPSEAYAEVSLDGIEYVRVGDFSLKAVNENGENDNFAYWTDLDLDATARYVKIYLRASFFHTFINEIQVYGEAIPTEWLLGDVDGNGAIKASDYMMLKKATFGMTSLSQGAFERADIKMDGRLTATDYMMLKRACFGSVELDNSRFDNINLLNSIPRLPAMEYADSYFEFGDGESILALSLPSEWAFESDGNGGYDILRTSCENCQIGRVFNYEADDTDGWNALTVRQNNVNGIDVTEYAEEQEGEFRYRYTFKNGENDVITLIAKVMEVSEKSAMKLLNGKLTAETEATGVGTLSYLQGGNILILGNSFISTSDIGSILDEMLFYSENKCNVEAVSIGYATVGTFISDTSLMSDIEAGTYDAVFICGLYSESEIDYLKILQMSCETSDTALVVFPAHNESRGAINAASEACPWLYCLDWKAELDMLIDQGVDKWELCINDSHLHSTPLAGYVGAHMIYRAIYGEMPVDLMYAIDQTYVDSVLGDYTEYGVLKNVQIDDVKAFG